MNRKFHILVVSKAELLKLSIVAILLMTFSGAYIINFLCLCNLKHPKLIVLEQNYHQSNKKQHDENTREEHQRDSKSDGCCSNGCDCCKDLTSFFIADLPQLTTIPLELKVKTVNSPFLILNINTPKHEYIISQFIAYQYKLPPPKIPDIRVFIQSFII